MAILTDGEIIEAYKKGDIYISDFNPNREYKGNGKYTGKLGPNGYDLTLNEKLLIYVNEPLDMKKDNPTQEIIIPPEGFELQPGQLYLGKTNEYTKTNNYVPILEGRSSTARLGMMIHQTAGFGDIGFEGYWTLEITVTHPVRVYPNVSVCQISYNTIEGKVRNRYNGKYQKAQDVLATRMHQDEIFENDSKTENNIKVMTQLCEKLRGSCPAIKYSFPRDKEEGTKDNTESGNCLEYNLADTESVERIFDIFRLKGPSHFFPSSIPGMKKASEIKELEIEFKGFPISSDIVNKKARECLLWLNPTFSKHLESMKNLLNETELSEDVKNKYIDLFGEDLLKSERCDIEPLVVDYTSRIMTEKEQNQLKDPNSSYNKFRADCVYKRITDDTIQKSTFTPSFKGLSGMNYISDKKENYIKRKHYFNITFMKMVKAFVNERPERMNHTIYINTLEKQLVGLTISNICNDFFDIAPCYDTFKINYKNYSFNYDLFVSAILEHMNYVDSDWSAKYKNIGDIKSTVNGLFKIDPYIMNYSTGVHEASTGIRIIIQLKDLKSLELAYYSNKYFINCNDILFEYDAFVNDVLEFIKDIYSMLLIKTVKCISDNYIDITDILSKENLSISSYNFEDSEIIITKNYQIVAKLKNDIIIDARDFIKSNLKIEE